LRGVFEVVSAPFGGCVLSQEFNEAKMAKAQLEQRLVAQQAVQEEETKAFQQLEISAAVAAKVSEMEKKHQEKVSALQEEYNQKVEKIKEVVIQEVDKAGEELEQENKDLKLRVKTLEQQIRDASEELDGDRVKRRKRPYSQQGSVPVGEVV